MCLLEVGEIIDNMHDCDYTDNLSDGKITDYIQEERRKYEIAAKSLWFGFVEVLSENDMEDTLGRFREGFYDELKTLGIIK